MPRTYEDLLLKEVKDLLKKLPPNVRIRVYYDSKEEQDGIMRPRKKNKYTMSQVCTKLDQIGDALFEFIKTTDKNFKQVNTRIDNLEKRIDSIDARLDYIVKANKLKDLPTK